MAEYKCICCGEIKEVKDKKDNQDNKEKQEELVYSCPSCGYKMYKTPYDKREVLIGEIEKFLHCLMIEKIEPSSFEYVGKRKDDGRFPSLDKIQGFICAAEKTEKLSERINHTLDEIKSYLHTPFLKEYKVKSDGLVTRTESLDKILGESVSDLGEEYQAVKLILPSIELSYSEIPNNELLELADKVIEQLELLSQKLYKFIKQNNVYGTAYRQKFKINYKFTDKSDPIADLSKAEATVAKIVQKKYMVDIFSDGSDELCEMLRVMWNALATILYIPILKKNYTFKVQAQTIDGEKALCDFVLEQISPRYQAVKSLVLVPDFWQDKDEKVLFELYNKMIQRDTYGFMGVNKYNLVLPGEHEKQLNELIGLASIKESIKKIKAFAVANKGSDALNVHMCFYGNPGTGKTEVARIIAGILYENKILPSNKVVEVDRSGLVSQYVGETPIKTLSKIHEAMGGVLFIDEAYALVPKEGGFDYGNEAVATLIKAMEDYRGKFCVILAGYKNQMADMIASNPGFKSRIQFELDFPNYSREELGQITSLMLEKRKYSMTDTAMSKILDITDVKRKEPNFANAREIRNILDQVIMCQNLRAGNPKDKEIGIVDVNKYITDAHINLPTSGEGMAQKILTAEEELDALIGLDSVKRMVKKIRAYAKRNKDDENFNVHMCFYGNPGTGKTEVARILSRILYDAGVLPEAKLIETDAHGLIGKYVGETAPKTEAKIADAMGGVLFIDEAYSLIDNASSSGTTINYGEEAIAVLLKKMEDSRGKFGVILAGYQTEMKNMLSSNPGLESRIQFTLEFPDYTREELGEIAVRFASKKKYVLENTALARILDVAEYYRGKPNFANARTVRNILDQVIMNQNLRADDNDLDDNTIILEDVEDYISDEKIMQKPSSERRIGFY